MLNNLVSDLSSYKKIAIFGFGKEGKSFYDFALKYLPNVKLLIVDAKSPSGVQESKSVKFFTGKDYLLGLSKVDIIVKSPGISLYKLGIAYDEYNFTSTTELFIKHFKKQIVGVTGTKGKSTLVSIIYELLKNSKRQVVLCGNIGTPAFDMIESIDVETQIVMELSSHQLLNIKYSPHIAILTNLFQDHLDYYKSLEEYYDAKFNIFRFQDEDDRIILNLQEPYRDLNSKIFKTKNLTNVFTHKLNQPIEFNIENGFIHKSSLQILERLVDILAIDKEIYFQTISTFKTLPHRLEYVDRVNNLAFINDSISTIPEATMEAIKILKNVQSLILGGYDRGIEYDALVEFLVASSVENIVLFSDTGKIIYDKLQEKENSLNVRYVNSLEESVKKVFTFSKNEDAIALFSPAASSFNEYKNFMERGEEFKRVVQELKTT